MIFVNLDFSSNMFESMKPTRAVLYNKREDLKTLIRVRHNYVDCYFVLEMKCSHFCFSVPIHGEKEYRKHLCGC